MAEFHHLTEVNLNECIENPMFETIAEMRRPKKSPKWIEQDNKCGKALRLTIQLKKVIVIFFFFFNHHLNWFSLLAVIITRSYLGKIFLNLIQLQVFIVFNLLLIFQWKHSGNIFTIEIKTKF